MQDRLKTGSDRAHRTRLPRPLSYTLNSHCESWGVGVHDSERYLVDRSSIPRALREINHKSVSAQICESPRWPIRRRRRCPTRHRGTEEPSLIRRASVRAQVTIRDLSPQQVAKRVVDLREAKGVAQFLRSLRNHALSREHDLRDLAEPHSQREAWYWEKRRPV